MGKEEAAHMYGGMCKEDNDNKEDNPDIFNNAVSLENIELSEISQSQKS